MPVVPVGLFILLYNLCILPFALDVLQDVKKHVIPYLTHYLAEFGVSERLSSSENVSTKSADGCSESVKRWNHLLKENVQLRRTNTILEETCKDLLWKLDLTGNFSDRSEELELSQSSACMENEGLKDEEAVQREQTSQKRKSLEDAYEFGMSTEEQVASLHRVFEPVLEEMQRKVDVQHQELAQESTQWSEKEAKMRAEYTALEEEIKSIISSIGVKMISEQEDLCELEEKVNALHVENTELMGKIKTFEEEETTLRQQENALRETLVKKGKKRPKKGEKSKEHSNTLKNRMKGFQREKKTARSSHKF